MDTGLREYPEIVKEYFSTLVKPTDNKFSALNSAVWSGGTFIYVPKGVRTDIPIQSYFRINAENSGQFERTLIIVDEGASVNYVEGCTAPSYSSDSLHAAVVEVFVKRDGYCRYTTIQKCSKNVYSLELNVPSHGKCDNGMGRRESRFKMTMKYPSVYLDGEGACGTIPSPSPVKALTKTVARMIHAAPNTSSSIVSKSIAKDGGAVDYRGLFVLNATVTVRLPMSNVT